MSKTYKEYLNETPHIIGDIDGTGSFSRKSEWEKYSKKGSNIVKSGISPKKYKLYRKVNYFYLTDYDDNYIAVIEGEEKVIQGKKCFLISHGHTNIRGTYKVLMFSILEFTNIEFIFSDENISNNAKKFYSKILTDNSMGRPYLLISNKILPYTETVGLEDIFGPSKRHIRVGVSLENKYLEEMYTNLQDNVDRGIEKWALYEFFYASIYGDTF